VRVTKNFYNSKDRDWMSCPCCNAFVYNQDAMERIQHLRSNMGKSFSLTKYGGGFFRCEKYQESINPGVNSQHCKGRAMDILATGWDGHTKWRFLKEAMYLGLSVKYYSDKNFFHVDLREGDAVTW